MEKFRGNARRVRVQYEQLKSLKENLAVNEVIVRMDFTVNYTCQSVDEYSLHTGMPQWSPSIPP